MRPYGRVRALLLPFSSLLLLLLPLLAVAACGGGGTGDGGGTTGPSDAVATLQIQTPPTSLAAGQSAPLTVVLRTATGQDVTAAKGSCVTWSSSDARVATVSAPSGTSVTVTGVAGGDATLTASCAGMSATAALQVTNPSPTVVSLAPATIEMGGPAFTLTVNGTGFVPGSVVRWNGVDRPTTFVSAAQLTAAIPAADLARTGLVAVTVVNPSPGGGTSAAFSAAISLPRVTAIEVAPPTAPLVAGQTTTLRVTLRGAGGQDVTAGQATCVRWSTSDPTIATVDSTSGVVTGVSGGPVTLTARCGTLSATAALQVTNPTPAVVTLGPSAVAPGSGAFTLVVTGTGFVRTSVVRWNGTPRATTYVSPTELRAAIPAADVAADGLADVSVVNPAPGGGTSASAVFGIVALDTRLAAGGSHTCSLTAQGQAYCWGANDFGQLGVGTTTDSPVPVAVRGGLTFRSIAAGATHTCALTTAGRLYCWGANDSGQLGDATTDDRSSPAPVQGTLTFASVSAGRSHTCAVAVTGEAYCWGLDLAGQLGDGETGILRASPTPVRGGLRLRSVTAGGFHTCALAISGAAYCWGANDGALGNGGTAPSATPVAVATSLGFRSLTAGAAHTCALTAAGQAYCWGTSPVGALGTGTTTSLVPTAVQGGATFASLVAGDEHTCGLTATTGQASCWGANGVGQLGDGTTTDRLLPVAVQGQASYRALAAGGTHTCALTASGQSACWGSNFSGELGTGTLPLRTTPVAASAAASFITVRAGNLHTCALAAAGQSYCWGGNALGQLGTGTTSTSVPTPTPARTTASFTTLSAGGFHSCALTGIGAAYCWGANGVNQLGTGTASPSIAVPTPAPNAPTFTATSAGEFHTCALTASGAAYCWGLNDRGALGTGTSSDAATPALVQGSLAFKSIGAGSLFTCAVTTAGQGYCWGAGFNGQLGTGSTADSRVPVAVRGTGLVLASVAAGGAHACALSATGVAYCWGSIDFGATIVSAPTAVTGAPTFASVTVGSRHACALTPSGQAYCWGRNDAGQLGDGTTTNRAAPTLVAGNLTFTALSAGQSHTCGISSSQAYCWGSSQLGQLGNGDVGFSTQPVAVAGGVSFPGVRGSLGAFRR